MVHPSSGAALAGALAIALSFGVPTIAHAGDPAHGEELKTHGDDLLHGGDFKGAVAAYDAAYAADPNPAILYNRARALQSLHAYARALDSLEKFSKDAPDDLKGRVPRLDSLLAELRARVSTLVVTSTVPGAAVVVNDQTVGTTPFRTPVRTDAGPSVIEVRAVGYQTFRLSLDLPGGTLTNIDAPLIKETEAPPPPSPPSPAHAPAGRRVASIVLLGAAGLFAGTGAILLAVREGDVHTLNDACPGGICPSSRDKELTGVRNRALLEGPVAAGFFIGAAVAAGVGIAVWPWSGNHAHVIVRGDMLSVEGSF